jgi:hypothetical protein
MAKKKTPRRGGKSTVSWYKKVIVGSGVLAVFLAAYCYFTPESGNIPVIVGPNYPKRTPGVVSKQATYAVYDRLAEAPERTQKLTVARLMPPDEVPEWHSVGEDSPETRRPPSDTSVAANGTKNPAEFPNSRKPQSKALASIVPAPSVTLSHSTEPLDRGISPSEKGISGFKKPNELPLKSEKSGNKRESRVQDLQKKTTQHSLRNGPSALPKANQPGGQYKTMAESPKTLVRMQIGGFCTAADQAEKRIKRLMQKGGAPGGMRPLVQKANIKGKVVYRVILVGYCSAKTLALCQNWVRQQNL